jgi:uncharacterized protein Yka (UPF0111/DUF47 family)
MKINHITSKPNTLATDVTAKVPREKIIPIVRGDLLKLDVTINQLKSAASLLMKQYGYDAEEIKDIIDRLVP